MHALISIRLKARIHSNAHASTYLYMHTCYNCEYANDTVFNSNRHNIQQTLFTVFNQLSPPLLPLPLAAEMCAQLHTCTSSAHHMHTTSKSSPGSLAPVSSNDQKPSPCARRDPCPLTRLPVGPQKVPWQAAVQRAPCQAISRETKFEKLACSSARSAVAGPSVFLVLM
jgi:hypothetical protein